MTIESPCLGRGRVCCKPVGMTGVDFRTRPRNSESSHFFARHFCGNFATQHTPYLKGVGVSWSRNCKFQTNHSTVYAGEQLWTFIISESFRAQQSHSQYFLKFSASRQMRQLNKKLKIQPAFSINLKTMKIAIFHNIMWSKYKGGVFSAINDLAQGKNTQISFTQIAETEGDRVSLGGVDLAYHRYPFELIFTGSYSSTPTYKRVAALVKRAWKTDADVVVLPGYERIEYWAMLATLILRKKPRAVFCDSTAYDRPRHTIKSIAKKIFFSLCNGFFGYGIRSREYLMTYGVAAEKIYYRCQAAALPLDYNKEAALARRVEFGPKPGTPPSFLYVGRISHEKGLDTLIRAMETVVAAHPDAKLNLIGAGPMKEELQRAAKQAGLDKNINFLGSMGVEKLAEQYTQATALVLPSTSEPWGLVVNEALSQGCPSVVSNICGCVPELVINGKTGFVFQANSAIDLAQNLLATPDAFKDIRVTAQHCIEHMQNFLPANAALQIIDGCQSVFNKSRGIA